MSSGGVSACQTVSQDAQRHGSGAFHMRNACLLAALLPRATAAEKILRCKNGESNKCPIRS